MTTGNKVSKSFGLKTCSSSKCYTDKWLGITDLINAENYEIAK